MTLTQPSAGSPRYARPDRSHRRTTAPPPLCGTLRSSRCAASPPGSSQRSATGSLLRCLPRPGTPRWRCCSARQSWTAAGCGGTRPAADARTVRFPRGALFQQAGGQLVVKAEQRVVIVTQRGFRRAGQGGAMSMISSGFWADASIRPSASTRRPSASVFITSTFLPLR